MSEDLRHAVKAAKELEMTAGAFEDLRKAIVNDITDSTIEQRGLREELALALVVLRKVENALIATAAGADIEKHRELLAEAGFSA